MQGGGLWLASRGPKANAEYDSKRPETTKEGPFWKGTKPRHNFNEDLFYYDAAGGRVLWPLLVQGSVALYTVTRVQF